MLFLASFTNIHAQNGPDGGRAALFITYAKKAKKAIRAQDALLAVNLTGHKYLKEEVKEITTYNSNSMSILTVFRMLSTQLLMFMVFIWK